MRLTSAGGGTRTGGGATDWDYKANPSGADEAATPGIAWNGGIGGSVGNLSALSGGVGGGRGWYGGAGGGG